MAKFKVVKVKDIGKVVTGNTPPTKEREYYGDEYLFIKPTDMRVGERYVPVTEEYYSQLAYEKFKKALIPPLSTCVVTIGSLGKKLCLTDRFCFTNQAVNAVIPFEQYDKLFVYYLFSNINSAVANLSNGTASGRENVSKTSFENLNVVVPNDKLYQTAIANLLNVFDEVIENNNSRIQFLEATAKELYKEWFVRMRFPGYKKAKFEKGVPKGWTIKKVAKAFDITGGGTPSTEKAEYWDGDINWFTPTDITGAKGWFLGTSTHKITQKGLDESSAQLFPPYSIMMTSRATIGAIGINTKESCTNQGFITCIPNETIPFTFLYFWIYFNKEYFETLGTGSTFLEITKGTFKKIDILVPNRELINDFHKIAQPVFQQIENLQKQSINLRQTRDCLLPRLISGNLQIKEALKVHNQQQPA